MVYLLILLINNDFTELKIFSAALKSTSALISLSVIRINAAKYYHFWKVVKSRNPEAKSTGANLWNTINFFIADCDRYLGILQMGNWFYH